MLIPSDKNYPRGFKRAKARLRYHHMEDKTTPQARAALGRKLFHDNVVPQKYAVSIEAIAWHREAGTNLGYWNRTQRKKRTH